MYERNITTIIMAGGLGNRMNSQIPKVLHLIKERPMICHVIERALEVGSHTILIIVGKYKETIQNEIAKYFSMNELMKFIYIEQIEPKGTGHAISCCLDFFKNESIDPYSNVLILSGDVPLIRLETVQNILKLSNTILVTQLENPYGCGRILFVNNYIKKIIEEKDCTEQEKGIKYVNCGIYNFTVNTLLEYIPLINNKNASNEYYLTDIIEILSKLNVLLFYYDLPVKKQIEILNINTQHELLLANSN